MFATGCMRIYSDDELPDLSINWYSECAPEIAGVAIEVRGVDDPSFAATMRTSCAAMTSAYPDVPRERFVVTATLLGANDAPLRSSIADVDARRGFDETVELYLPTFPNFNVAWLFQPDDTCASLGIATVEAQLSSPTATNVYALSAPCEVSEINGLAPEGTFALVLRGRDANGATIAASETSGPFTIEPDAMTRVPALYLTPCTSCP